MPRVFEHNKSAAEIRRFSLFAIHMGVSQSPSPHTMRVGHMIFFAKEVKSCSTTFLKVFRIPLPDARKSVLPYFLRQSDF